MTPWEMRPARDLDLHLAERLRSHNRENGLIGRAGNGLWRATMRAYLTVAHRLEITGREHIPDKPPFVMVGNHTSHLDALSLGATLPAALARKAVPLAAGNVFFGKTASAAFAATALNALPIWRDSTSTADLTLLRQRLVEDQFVFILFPEGTRARDGLMGRFRPGLGAFVAGSAIPVLPCHLDGAHACWPPSRRLPRPGRLRVAIGAPLRFDDVANDRQGWKEVAEIAEQAVRHLQPLHNHEPTRSRPDLPDRPAI